MQNTMHHHLLSNIWSQAHMDADALRHMALTGSNASFRSSFDIGTLAQTSIGLAALGAMELGHLRGADRQNISVDMDHALMECTGQFSIDGVSPDLWDAFSGVYPCADRPIRIHANFPHHRDGFLKILGLDTACTREQAAEAVRPFQAFDLEDALYANGLVGSAIRSFEEWDATPHAQVLSRQPLFTMEKIGDCPPAALGAIGNEDLPLAGINVLDLTRILAGPVAGRTLAGYGANVLLVNSPRLPNISAIAETSRGKLSAWADLKHSGDRARFAEVLEKAHVFIQGYRPHALQSLGWGPEEVAGLRPGIVYVSLSAYGSQGPWSDRRGFDSLVQSAMGFNVAEAHALGMQAPCPLPMQILDQATGFLIAFLVSAALHRQQTEGGSWHVQVSLAQTAQLLRHLGQHSPPPVQTKPDFLAYQEDYPSGFGRLTAIRHSARFERTPCHFKRPSVPPGTNDLAWPA